MVKITKEAALEYHQMGRPGKIEVKPTKPYHTQTDLSLAYSPGVAYPCLEIQKNPDDVYKYTDKGNLVAVISNGTAVLGLGDIGAMSGKPVMEVPFFHSCISFVYRKGLLLNTIKWALFKIYGGIDVFDIVP
jgi:malate dehydrogenase (oxaloacetate-decarboxylating)(NADP+)